MAGEQTDSVNNKTLHAALLYTGEPAAVHCFREHTRGAAIINSRKSTLLLYTYTTEKHTLLTSVQRKRQRGMTT